MLQRRVHMCTFPTLRWETFRKGNTLATLKTSSHKGPKEKVTLQREANGAGFTDGYWPDEGEDNHLVFDELVEVLKEKGWEVFRDHPIDVGRRKKVLPNTEPLMSAFVGGCYH